MDDTDLNRLRELKRDYLCSNLDPNLFEEFAEFAESHAEQTGTDVDSWSLQKIQDLVAQFKQSYAEQIVNEVAERSFAMYQTSSGEGLNLEQEDTNQNTDTVLEVLNNEAEVPKEKAFIKNKPDRKETPPKIEVVRVKPPVVASPSKDVKKVAAPAPKESSATKNNNSSAMELLDSVFEEADNKKAKKIESDEFSKSFFDSSQFWQVPAVSEPVKGKTPSSAPQKSEQKPKKDKSEIQTFEYNNSVSAFEYFNTATIADNKSFPENFDKFNTFSIMTEQQIKKKKVEKERDGPRPMAKSLIKMKEVVEYHPQSEMLPDIDRPKKKTIAKRPHNGPDANRMRENFVDSVACSKTKELAFSSQPALEAKITNHEIVSRSLFAANYIMYHMRVLPAGKVCKRNYEDFSRLRATLSKFYPGIQLPYLEKEGWLSDTSDEYAKKQGGVLELFMADILAHPELRNSRILEDFLGLNDHKKMKRKFEEYDRLGKVKSIEQLCLLEGKVKVCLTEDERIYKEQSHKLLNKMESNFDRLRRLVETLSYHYDQSMGVIRSISDVIKDMMKHTEEFNQSVHAKQLEFLEESFKKMRVGFKENFARIKFDQDILQGSVLPFVRYEKENLRTSRQIIDISNTFTSRYLKRSLTEATPSSDSYLSPKNNEFKQGVQEESKSLTVLKYQAGFWLAQASTEQERILNWLGAKIERRWKEIGTKYLGELSSSVNLWSSVV